MPGPPTIEALLTLLRRPDVGLVLEELTRAVVPGQVARTDHIVVLAWATRDLGRTLDSVSLPFRRTARDRVLEGATAVVPYGPVLLLLETPLQPDEGRVAGYLSHYGEGLLAFYLERPRFLPPSHAAPRPPRPHRTPFGRRGWLLPHDWPWGPFVVALEDERRPRG